VDRDNHARALGAPARAYYSPRISPDGQRVAVTIASETEYDVWVYNLPDGPLTRLTFDGHSSGAVWSPDGKRIAFLSTRSGGFTILLKSVDGTGAEESLFFDKDHFATPESWSPNGRFVSLRFLTADRGFDILIVPLEGDRKPRPFGQTEFNEAGGRFSPNGHWIAYVSNESGRNEVYVQPFPGPGAKWQVSTEGGSAPVWSRNGRELFYMTTDRKIMSLAVTTQPNFKTAARRTIGDIPPGLPGRPGRTNGLYDVSVDGQRLLYVKASEDKPAISELRVILNWTEELKRLVPTSRQP
jgi:Tol biopolymer transport system component